MVHHSFLVSMQQLLNPSISCCSIVAVSVVLFVNDIRSKIALKLDFVRIAIIVSHSLLARGQS